MKLSEMTVEGFLRELASDSPAPGGGSAAALTGAEGAALCGMTARLTVGRDAYRAAWEEMREVGREADALGARFRELVDEDTSAFLSVMAARRLPKNTETERAIRDRAIAEAALHSALVPMETLRAATALARLVARAVDRGNPGCLTDAASAAQMARAGAMAAAYNVRVNLPSVAEARARDRLARETSEALAEVIAVVARTERMADARLDERSAP